MTVDLFISKHEYDVLLAALHDYRTIIASTLPEEMNDGHCYFMAGELIRRFELVKDNGLVLMQIYNCE